MLLYLIRHAIAGEADPSVWPDDRERPLTKDGAKRFRAAARGLRQIAPSVDRLLSSGYTRAWQTAEILQREAGWPAPVAFAPLESGHPAQAVIDGLVERGEAGAVALVGHEPDLQSFCAILLAGAAGAVDAPFKKGGVACLELPDGVRPGGGRLQWFVPPKLLRQLATGGKYGQAAGKTDSRSSAEVERPRPSAKQRLAQALLLLPADAGARRLAAAYLRDAAKARRLLLSDEDPEALHDFRVALRHLRSVLRAYRPYLQEPVKKKTRRRLRELVDATAECRDREVQIAWLHEQRPSLTPEQRADVDPWLDELASQQARATRRLRRVVRKRLPKLRRRLLVELDAPAKRAPAASAEPTLSGAATIARMVEQHSGELQQSLLQVRALADVTPAHDARIAAKRLRYLLEPLAVQDDDVQRLVAELTALQTLLGDLHDVHLREAELTRPDKDTAGEATPSDEGAGPAVAESDKDADAEAAQSDEEAASVAAESEEAAPVVAQSDADSTAKPTQSDAESTAAAAPGRRELAARARAEQSELFARFQRDWSPAAVEAFATRLASTSAGAAQGVPAAAGGASLLASDEPTPERLDPSATPDPR